MVLFKAYYGLIQDLIIVAFFRALYGFSLNIIHYDTVSHDE